MSGELLMDWGCCDSSYSAILVAGNRRWGGTGLMEGPASESQGQQKAAYMGWLKHDGLGNQLVGK